MAKTLEERMDEAERRGKDYFRQGLNCSECVLRTFMDMHETGLPESIIRLAWSMGVRRYVTEMWDVGNASWKEDIQFANKSMSAILDKMD